MAIDGAVGAETVAATVKRPLDVHVGRRISERRFALRLSSDTVSAQLGMTIDQLVLLETGHTPVDANLLVNLCDVLRVKPSWFFVGLSLRS